jgi:hypothetical protein
MDSGQIGEGLHFVAFSLFQFSLEACISARADHNTAVMMNRTCLSTGGRARLPGLVLAGLLAPLASGCGAVHWQNSLDPALQRAASFNQLVLVQFQKWADATCRDADNTVFANDQVIKTLQDFQCVRLDFVLNASLADQWGVSVVPTYLILRPDATIVDRRSGRLDPDEFRAFLRWAALRR